ncbi:hypothetical protein ACJZ2D_012679 [Fusarium nematophilum]
MASVLAHWAPLSLKVSPVRLGHGGRIGPTVDPVRRSCAFGKGCPTFGFMALMVATPELAPINLLRGRLKHDNVTSAVAIEYISDKGEHIQKPLANHTRDGFQKGQLQKGGACDVEGGALPPSTDMSQKMAMELQTKAILKYGRTAQQLDSLRSAEMDVHDWQASRIRNSRFLQDGDVKPWPWSFQVKIIGTAGSGRHSLLDRICFDEFTDDDDDSFVERDSGCRQTSIRGLTCNVWFEIPISLTSHGDGHALTEEELFFWLTHGMRDCDALMLVYDLTDAKSFELLCEFCARCVYQDVGIASLPCLVVGTKCDLPDQRHSGAGGGGCRARRGREDEPDEGERGCAGGSGADADDVGGGEEDERVDGDDGAAEVEEGGGGVLTSAHVPGDVHGCSPVVDDEDPEQPAAASERAGASGVRATGQRRDVGALSARVSAVNGSA